MQLACIDDYSTIVQHKVNVSVDNDLEKCVKKTLNFHFYTKKKRVTHLHLAIGLN
jgi:hypothetical protein